MKKMLKIIGILILVLIVLIIALLLYLKNKPFAPKDYTGTLPAGGEIEAKYLQMGSHEISYIERDTMQSFKKYEIWYPSDITSGEQKYPVVIFSNGTGVIASKYTAVFEHLASWGFIVLGTEEENSWNGFSSEMCLRFIQKANEHKSIDGWETNPFYGHVDIDNIGVSGHSQGGVGVINAVNENKNGYRIKAVFAASPTNIALASALEWDYDAAQIKIPVFLVSGTGNMDENMVVSGAQLKEIYDTVPDSVTKVMARRSNADHGEMLYSADGYMTAWFLWHLQGDEYAAKAFTGADAELLQNKLYLDQKITLP